MAADRADEENLKTTGFERGEWGDVPIALDMDYGMVAETFGSAAAPFATMTPLALVVLAFLTGELDHALSGKPDDLLAAWEAAITARGAQAATGDAATNARAAAMAACTSEVERMALRLVEGKDGVMQLVTPLRELPLVQMDAPNAQPFKRPARFADAHGAMPTARIRSLATRLTAPGSPGRQRLFGDGAGEVGLAADGARAFGQHPGAGVFEGGTGRR